MVIDSVAALIRNEQARHADSAQLLGQQAAVLKRLAARCHIPVVVTNQVRSIPFYRGSYLCSASDS